MYFDNLFNWKCEKAIYSDLTKVEIISRDKKYKT